MRRLVTTCLLTLASALLMSCGSNTSSSTSEAGERVAPVEGKTEVEKPVDHPDSIVLPAEPGEPCWSAKRHSIEELAALADVPVWLPESEPASKATLTGAWTCGGGDTPVLTFGPITVSYESGYGTPLDWERKANDSGGEVRTILGEPGLLMPSTGPNIKGEVMVVVNGDILVRVLGEPSVPSDDLVAIADSIDLDDPVES